MNRPMSSPAHPSHLSFARANRFIPIGIALGLVAWILAVAGVDLPVAFAWVLPLIWLYALAVVFVVQWGITAIRRRPPPRIPSLPPAAQGKRSTLYALLGIVVVITALREGIAAPAFVLDFSAYNATHITSVQGQYSGNTMQMDGPPLRMAGRYVHCEIGCSPAGTLCDATLAELRCDNHRPDMARVEPVVHVLGSVSLAPEPWCFFPLIKEATVDIAGTLTISASDETRSTQQSVMLSGTIDQSVTGPMSCHGFRTLAGKHVAAELAKHLQQVIDAN